MKSLVAELQTKPRQLTAEELAYVVEKGTWSDLLTVYLAAQLTVESERVLADAMRKCGPVSD